jgi:peptidoglycan/LPS O-acetylase OafA/YrhL
VPPARDKPGPSAAGFYRPELDGLRFFAFLMVFMAHAIVINRVPPGWPPALAAWVGSFVRAGFFGVDLFFVLSAYLITELLLREVARRGRLDVRAFWIRRILRIWPLYYSLLLACVFVLPRFGANRLSARYAFAYAAFAGNWACARWGFPSSGISLLWSVSIEEQFYLIWPLVIRLVSPRKLGWAVAAMLLAASGTRLYLLASSAQHPAVWCNTLARLDPIALGVLLALVLRSRLPRLSAPVRASMVAGAFLIWVLVDRFVPIYGGPGPAMLGLPLAAIAGVMMVTAALGAGARLGALLSSRPIVYLGRISYGLYAFHLLAIHFGKGLPVAAPWQRLISFALTILVAVLSYELYEKAFLRFKVRFTHVASRPGG